MEFWNFATTFRRGEVDDMILTPISADGERGEAVTIAGDAIPFVCAVGGGRSPGLLLLAPLLWRRRRRSALAPR